MHSILIVGAAMAGVLIAVAVLSRPRPDHRPVVATPPTPRAAFRVLRTEEELRDALRRAAWSEHLAANACRSRTERSGAQLPPLAPPARGKDDGDRPLSA